MILAYILIAALTFGAALFIGLRRNKWGKPVDPPPARLIPDPRPDRPQPRAKRKPRVKPTENEFSGGPLPLVDAAGLRTAAVIDTETTGLSKKDEIIEIAIILIGFHPGTLEITGIIDAYVGRREPSVPINPFATRRHKITIEELRGRTLDLARLRDLMNRAEFFIAHNAAYDSRFVRSLMPAAPEKQWLCSLRNLDWRNFESAKLTALAHDHGIGRAGAHGAAADAGMLLSLLKHPAHEYFAELVAAYDMKVDRVRPSRAPHPNDGKRISMRCPECYHDISETIGNLRGMSELVCPGCDSAFEIRITG